MKPLLHFPLLIAALAATLTSCSPPPPPMAMPPPKVSVALPQTGSVQDWDEYPGHIEAVEMVEVKARVPGYLDSIHFQDGAEVKAGDLLFVIDPRPYQAELARAQAECKRAETRLELAKNDFQRATTLHASRAISEEEFDTRNKAVRETESSLAAARAAEELASLNLGYTRITAPISGRIGRRIVTVGNLIQVGGVTTPALATIVSMEPIHCYFDADEPAFLRYRANRQAALPCELALVNEDAFPHKGRVDFFDNQINPKTGTIRMRGVFANADRVLVSGMFAKVRVPAGPPAEALLVPAVAVSSDQGQKFVLVVNKYDMVEARPIKAGRQHGAMVAVTGGLTTQDRVIVTGLVMAHPGIKVEVVDTPANGPAASRPGKVNE
ncbi:MAG: efflux RND transporter periplasmic adaptor subunit [Verrucomicrobia bacterium]|nr:efflux RND transporter periplasmic adaptor subunit [Verrucomicrobiota bacterium]